MSDRPAAISGHEAGGYEDPGPWYGEQAARRPPVRVADPGRGLTTREGCELEGEIAAARRLEQRRAEERAHAERERGPRADAAATVHAGREAERVLRPYWE